MSTSAANRPDRIARMSTGCICKFWPSRDASGAYVGELVDD